MERKTEFSTSELIKSLKENLSYLINNWKIIMLGGLIGCTIGFFYAFFSKPIYNTDLTFVLSNNLKSGGLSSLIGQFGLDVGGNNDDAFSGDNIFELFKSERIVKRALFKQVPKTSETLINIIVKETYKGLEVKPYFKSQLPFPNDITQLTPIQDSLVREIYSTLTKSAFAIDKVDKKLSFYKVSATSTNETIAYYLPKYVLDEAANLYIDTKTKAAASSLNMLQKEADSLQNILGIAINTTASEADKTFNLNPTRQVLRSQGQLSQAKASVLGAAYAEVIKNLEIAKITLQKETPLYQIIDEPSLPLKRIKLSKLINLILGGFIGGFIVVFSLLIKFILKSEEQ